MHKSLISIPFLMLVACNGSGHAEGDEARPQGHGTRDFALSGFDKVALQGPDDVTVRVGPAASIRAQGDKAVLDQLEIDVVRGELRVRRKKDGLGISGPKGHAAIAVTMPSIRAASVAGPGDMKVDLAKADSFYGSVAGSGDLDIAAVEGANVDLSVTGSGDISVAKGRATKVSGSVAGSGSIDAAALIATDAAISIAGSGDVELGATGTAAISIIGSGGVTINGGAKCTVKKVGSGSARCS